MMFLLNKVTRGFIWVLLNNVSLFSISLILNIILARLLEPKDFGVVALAEVFLLFLNRVKELGFDYAMIHRQDRLVEVASINFTLQFILGIAIMFLGAGFSVLIAKIYGWPVGLSLFLLTVTAPIKGLVSSYNSLLDKSLAFKKNAILTVLTNLIFAFFMILLAWRGFGYLSLTLGLVPGILFNAFIFWFVSPVKLKFIWDKELVGWFLDFGPWWFWLIASLAALVISNFDNFLIGTFLGAAALGFYSRAYSFALLVTDRISFAFGRVLFPVFAKFQKDSGSLTKILSLQVGLIPRLILPLVILGLLNIHELIILLLGEKWLAMQPIIFGLFIFMLAKPLFDVFGYFLIAIGRPQETNKIMIIQAVLMLILEPVVLLNFGRIGLAVFAGLATSFSLVLFYLRLKDLVAFQIDSYWLYPIIANILALIVTRVLYQMNGFANLGFSLLFKTFIFLTVYTGLMLVVERKKLISDLKAFALLEKEAVAL